MKEKFIFLLSSIAMIACTSDKAPTPVLDATVVRYQSTMDAGVKSDPDAFIREAASDLKPWQLIVGDNYSFSVPTDLTPEFVNGSIRFSIREENGDVISGISATQQLTVGETIDDVVKEGVNDITQNLGGTLISVSTIKGGKKIVTQKYNKFVVQYLTQFESKIYIISFGSNTTDDAYFDLYEKIHSTLKFSK